MSQSCPCCGRVIEETILKLFVDLGQNMVRFGTREAFMPKKQIEILSVLVETFPNGIDNDDLITKVWGIQEPGNAGRALAVHICRINERFAGWGVEVSRGAGRRSIRYTMGKAP